MKITAENGNFEEAKYIEDNYKVIACESVLNRESKNMYWIELRECIKGKKIKTLSKYVVCYSDKKDDITGECINGKVYSNCDKLENGISSYAHCYHYFSQR